jgi:hypothetical protein
MGLLLQAMQGKLEGGGDVDFAGLVSTVIRTLDEKHVLVHVIDTKSEELLGAAGWTGALQPGDQDFLMVVDTNMGFNKANPHIDQEISYQVTLAEGERPRAELTLRYHHTADIRLKECIHEQTYGESYDDMMNRCYWDYVRIYVPGGSELKEVRGFDPDSVESLPGERGTQVFAGYFVLAPGEKRRVTLSYDLPATVVADSTYRLYAQKQPGTAAVPLRVQVSGMVEEVKGLRLAADRQFQVSLGP